MKPIDQDIDVFDRQHVGKGLSAQRRYPNESLIQFLASSYFKLSEEDRKSFRILEVGMWLGRKSMYSPTTRHWMAIAPYIGDR